MKLFNRLMGRLKPVEKLPSGFYKIRRPDGGVSVVDQMTMDYLRSTAPAPWQESLDAVLQRTRKARVYAGGSFGVEPTGELLLEVDEKGDLDALSEALRIKDGPAGHCMCLGDPTIELIGDSSERLAVISFHHGRSIRWNFWKDDAELVDGLIVLSWLAARGVTHPLEEYQNARVADAERERDWQRWLGWMPSCLKPFAAGMKDRASWAVFIPNPVAAAAGPNAEVDLSGEQGPIPGIERLHAAMRTTYPDGTERALALFGWYGTGRGVWTGFSAYEQFADKLLLVIPKANLVEALMKADLSENQREGGARFLSGHDARSLREAVLSALTGEVRNALLEQALKTADVDKDQRARWFLQRDPVN